MVITALSGGETTCVIYIELGDWLHLDVHFVRAHCREGPHNLRRGLGMRWLDAGREGLPIDKDRGIPAAQGGLWADCGIGLDG